MSVSRCFFLSFVWRKASCLFSSQIRGVNARAGMITPGIGKYFVINDMVFRVRLDCHRLRRVPGSVVRKNATSTILNTSKNSKFSSKDRVLQCSYSVRCFTNKFS